jgi:hypothetical protein
MDVEGNEGDIIDRDEVFRNIDGADGEENDDEDDDAEMLDEVLEPEIDIDEMYRNHLKPLIQAIAGVEDGPLGINVNRHEFGKVEDLYLSVDELFPMVFRPDSRREFVSAIHSNGNNTIKSVSVI